jgi:hypothetical protein
VVAVPPVAERDDQVLRVDEPVAVRVADPRVGRVVEHRDGAVPVDVVAGRAARQRQLAHVEEAALGQVPAVRQVPVDPALDVADDGRGRAAGDRPRSRQVEALRPARVERGGRRRSGERDQRARQDAADGQSCGKTHGDLHVASSQGRLILHHGATAFDAERRFSRLTAHSLRSRAA